MHAEFLFNNNTITTDITIVASEKYKQEQIEMIIDHEPFTNRVRRMFNKPPIGRDTIQVPGKLIPPVLTMIVGYDVLRLLSEKIRHYGSADDKFDIKINNDVYVGCFPKCIDSEGTIDFSVDTTMTKGQYDIYEWAR